MRDLSGTALTTAQQGKSYKPIVEFVFTGAHTYTYDTDRFLRVEHSEEPSSHKVEIILDNSDGVLTDKDLKSYLVTPKWGMVTSAGEETSEAAPLWVRDQRLDSVPGKLICSLTCIGIPDRLAEDKANDNYSHHWSSTKTVEDLITEVLDGDPVTEELTEQLDKYDTFLDFTNVTYVGIGQRVNIPNRTVTKLAFRLKKTGAVAGDDVVFRITDVEPGYETLAETTFPLASIGTDPAWCEVTFTTPVTINKDVWILCYQLGGTALAYVSASYYSEDWKSNENIVRIAASGSPDLSWETSDEDCAYKYKYSPAGGIEVFDHCASWTATYVSRDSLIDSYMPADAFFIAEGESRLDVLDKLLHYTGCERMFKEAGKVHILKPTISGATWVANTAYVVNDYVQPVAPLYNFAFRCTAVSGTSPYTSGATEPVWPIVAGGTIADNELTWTAVAFDYEYALTTGHTFFGKAIREALVIPNRIVVKSFEADADQYSGEATSAESYALLPISGAPIRTKLTSIDQGNSIAKAYISRLEVASQRGSATVPMNVGAEIWDYVKVTDERQSDFRIGNIGYLTRVYTPGFYRMTFGFGGVAVKGVPGTQLSVLRSGISDAEVLYAPDAVVKWGILLPHLWKYAEAIDKIQKTLQSIPSLGILSLYTDLAGGGFEIKDIKDPTTDESAATKGYVDSVASRSSSIIWKDVSERALSDLNRTVALDYTDLDLTAYTSANAKFALLLLYISVVSITPAAIAALYVRKNGTTPAIPQMTRVGSYNGDIAGAVTTQFVLVGLDSGQVVEYSIAIAGTIQVNSYIDVLGYIE